MTRQVLFLIPLLLILPLFMGLDGIMYSGPCADLVAFVVTIVMISWEMRSMKEKEKWQSNSIHI